jgi:hypothetical protein
MRRGTVVIARRHINVVLHNSNMERRVGAATSGASEQQWSTNGHACQTDGWKHLMVERYSQCSGHRMEERGAREQ